jgi:hypothetical protein
MGAAGTTGCRSRAERAARVKHGSIVARVGPSADLGSDSPHQLRERQDAGMILVFFTVGGDKADSGAGSAIRASAPGHRWMTAEPSPVGARVANGGGVRRPEMRAIQI